MNQLWLMTVVAALLAVIVIAQDAASQDYSDERFLNLVRRNEEDARQEERGRMAGLSQVDTRRRTSNMQRNSEKQSSLNQPTEHLVTMLQHRSWKGRENSKIDFERGNLRLRRCRTFRCRLQSAFGSEKADNREGEVKRNDKGKKRCMAWTCKKRSLIKVNNEERCMAWICRKRSLNVLSLKPSMKRNNVEMKQENLEEKKRTLQAKKWRKEEEEKKQDETTTEVKRNALGQTCIAWYCTGKRIAEKRGSEAIDTAKRIISRKQDEILDLLDFARDGKCRGLECLAKRTRELKVLEDASQNRKKEVRPCMYWECTGKRMLSKKTTAADIPKRIISRKNAKDRDFMGLSGEKCRGWECLTKRTRKLEVLEAASQNRKKEIHVSPCLFWDCTGKRMLSKDNAVADTSKRILSRKNDKDRDFMGLSGEKCRGWECLKKRLVNGVQLDTPNKCLSWDCDKRKADSGETTLEMPRPRSTKTQDAQNPDIQERDVPQYGITDGYKDMINLPIRRDG